MAQTSPRSAARPFEARCAAAVRPAVQREGRKLLRQGAATLRTDDPEGFLATVQSEEGTVYAVRIDWNDAANLGVLFAGCDCAAFQRLGEACPHVWAALLAADQAGRELRTTGSGPLVVEPESLRDMWDRSKPEPPTGRPGRLRAPTFARRSAPTLWRARLDAARNAEPAASGGPHGSWQAWYLLDIAASADEQQLVLQLFYRDENASSLTKRLRPLARGEHDPAFFADAEDRALLDFLLRTVRPNDPAAEAPSRSRWAVCELPSLLFPAVLPRLAATGRCGWALPDEALPAGFRALAWDGGVPWQLVLHLERDDREELARVSALLERDGVRRPAAEALLFLADGLVVFPDTLARLDTARGFAWLQELSRGGDLHVPLAEHEALLEALWSARDAPRIEAPEAWRLTVEETTPQPHLVLHTARGQPGSRLYEATVSFDYAGQRVTADDRRASLVDLARRRVLERDRSAEEAAFARLGTLGFKTPFRLADRRGRTLQVAKRVVPEAVPALIDEGWTVEIEGARVHRPEHLALQIQQHQGGFTLSGQANFGAARTDLPTLLAALRRGVRFVRLLDGSHGLLPDDWSRRYTPLAQLDLADDGERLNVLPSQAALLDAMLATSEVEIDTDSAFETLRQELGSFDGIAPSPEPRGFRGTLRGYQREGLGWLTFLARFGFGGCLADDMGLGKTVQVLARLQQRRLRRLPADETKEPSLIVAPRSLIYNWQEEAARFVPRLRVLAYTGLRRSNLLDRFAEHDVILTTYGTLRRDISKLKNTNFDYAILDEAQAIKNAGSQAAKACRLLQATHRLALTGTPIENHLGELGSIFAFLNPGMLGRFTALRDLGEGSDAALAIEALTRALRPFILRRTKEEVLADLPAKTEQTLLCELGLTQRATYNRLRDHYRHELERRIREVGFERAKIHVLEALLRLRQAACHPGLVEEARMDDESAKLDTLEARLDEVLGEGHKALVFSQFTRFLGLLRRRLDARSLPYAYLDGRTRRRDAAVRRFQDDPNCPLFLISLRAGGLGLNLTAADYVFILDPWWNPAVEAQAVDRAHRIGQTKPVFAYRLISRGTIEEKILTLQDTKRALADAILEANKSLISNLTAEDLGLLLS